MPLWLPLAIGGAIYLIVMTLAILVWDIARRWARVEEKRVDLERATRLGEPYIWDESSDVD